MGIMLEEAKKGDIMPYPNEHSCRLEDPDKFEKFNRENCGQKHDGKCIDVIYGIKEDGTSEIQALRYGIDAWSEDDAREHCESRDGTFEPAEKKDEKAIKPSGLEHRTFVLDDIEVRQEEGDENPKIRGHSAVFNKLSADLGGFREQIEPGAFAKSIKRDDIRALFNHDPNYILGRNKAGTLELSEDEKGLAIVVDPPDTSYANDLMVSIERGDITQMSFGFIVDGRKGEEWEGEWGKGNMIRTLKSVRLFDVSPVTYPAYPQTDVKVRSFFDKAGIDYDKFADLMTRHQAGEEFDESEFEEVRQVIEKLKGILPDPEDSEDGGSRKSAGDSNQLDVKRHQVIAMTHK